MKLHIHRRMPFLALREELPHDAELLGLRDYEIKDIQRDGRSATLQARYAPGA